LNKSATDFNVGVLSSKAWKGAAHLDEVPDRKELRQIPFEELWEEIFLTDAHFVCYAPETLPWVRYRKASITSLRDAGETLWIRMLVFDYDRPGHAGWTPETLSEWLTQLAEAEDSICMEWTVLYTTSHGARLVYVLDEPVDVEAAEGHHRWLTQRLREAGILLDDIDAEGYLSSDPENKPGLQYPTSDWTRCFRAAAVVREGSNEITWEQDYFEVIEQFENVLPVADLGTLGRVGKSGKAALRENAEPKPDMSDALALLTSVSASTGKETMSRWAFLAKRRLKGRGCYSCLYQDTPLAEVGGRDSSIMKLVGEASTMLYQLDDDGERITTKAHVYGLFLDPVLQLDPDEDTPDWTDRLWYAIEYCWAREDAEERHRETKKAEDAEDVLDLLDSIVSGMRGWCSHAALMGDEDTARDFATQHLIAITEDKRAHIMRPDGSYDPMSVAVTMVAPRIRALKMGQLLQTKVPTKDGKGFRQVNHTEILAEHGTLVSRIVGMPSAGGAWIKGIDRYDSVLHVPTFHRRTDLRPTFNKHVAAWLKALCGEEYEAVCNWIAWALRPEDGAICALSIHGEAGAGKKMIPQGLAECFNTCEVAGAETLVGDFQPGLVNTPILLVDEGWPKTYGGKHQADTFRELVGGGARYVNRKFKTPMNNKNPVRVIFTANNLDVVMGLCSNRDMSPEDRNALAIRIFHIDVKDRATRHLVNLGGHDHTDGWIAGDGEGQGDFLVAKHFLWIMENMRKPRGGRFLVEGNGGTTLLDPMRTQGAAGIVIEVIIALLQHLTVKSGTSLYPGMSVYNGRLHVTVGVILNYFRNVLSKTVSAHLTAARVRKALRGLVLCTPSIRTLPNRTGLGDKEWHEIDILLVQRQAIKEGFPCPALDALVRGDSEL